MAGMCEIAIMSVESHLSVLMIGWLWKMSNLACWKHWVSGHKFQVLLRRICTVLRRLQGIFYFVGSLERLELFLVNRVESVIYIYIYIFRQLIFIYRWDLLLILFFRPWRCLRTMQILRLTTYSMSAPAFNKPGLTFSTTNLSSTHSNGTPHT